MSSKMRPLYSGLWFSSLFPCEFTLSRSRGRPGWRFGTWLLGPHPPGFGPSPALRWMTVQLWEPRGAGRVSVPHTSANNCRLSCCWHRMSRAYLVCLLLPRPGIGRFSTEGATVTGLSIFLGCFCGQRGNGHFGKEGSVHTAISASELIFNIALFLL